MGRALAVVAPPLGAFGRVIGPFARTSCVGGVVLRAGSLVHGGQSHVTHQRRFCEIKRSNHKYIKFTNKHIKLPSIILSTVFCGIGHLFYV